MGSESSPSRLRIRTGSLKLRKLEQVWFPGSGQREISSLEGRMDGWMERQIAPSATGGGC